MRITLPSGTPAEVARPPGPPARGVVVIPDIMGLRPLFDMDKVTLNGKARPDDGLDLFTARADGAIGMQAAIHWKNG